VHVVSVGQAAACARAGVGRNGVLGRTWARRACRGWSRVGSRLLCPDVKSVTPFYDELRDLESPRRNQFVTSISGPAHMP
jgi:hypothetical protein